METATPSAVASSRCLGGVEVPIIGSDKVEWAKITVPSSHPTSSSTAPWMPRNAAGCYIFSSEHNAYLIWRIHKDSPTVLEVMEMFPSKPYHGRGLQLEFEDAIHPFAYIYMNEEQRVGEKLYLVYVVTLSGVAYLLHLRSPSSYISGSILPTDDLVVHNVQNSIQNARVTAVTATSGSLIIGRQDGSIGCYQLGTLEPSSPGFLTELRDDVGLGRLWHLVSRGKAIGSVEDVAISEVCGRKLLFVLHSDGTLRIWDIISHARLLNYNITSLAQIGSSPLKIWVGDANYDTNLISLATLHKVANAERIVVHSFGFSIGDKLAFSPEAVEESISLEEGRLMDLKFSNGNLWIIKEYGLLLYDLFQTDCEMGKNFYSLQEDFVADQLFQSSENSLDDLIWTNNSIFSLLKDQAAYFISSIFLRRLLQPGVHHAAALRATILDHKKYFSDYEFHSLTSAGLRKEIFNVIVGQGVATDSGSLVYYWKNFCSHFYQHWCVGNMPYALFVDPNSGAIGLIRKSSMSLFRCREGLEQLLYGLADGLHDVKSFELILHENTIDCDILLEVLRCMSTINRQFGGAATAVFYESLVNPVVSSDDIVLHLLKILETGYKPMASSVSVLGVDTTWQKKQAAHKNQRKFAVDMLLALRSLGSKSASWPRVLDVVEKYVECLIRIKSKHNFDLKGCYTINSTILISATAQIARLMYESAFDVLLLLGYLVKISGQIEMMQSDVDRIQLSLAPVVQEILIQWLVLHFVAVSTSEPLAVDDFSSRLSLLHIDSKGEKIPWSGLLGASDVTLACLLDFPYSEGGGDFLCSESFPDLSKLVPAVRNFASSVIWGGSMEDCSLSSSIIDLASRLLRHCQYEAAENIFLILEGCWSKRKLLESAQRTEDDCAARLHLLGFCLLLRAHCGGLHGGLKDQKIGEAIQCFFRAASTEGAAESIQKLSFLSGFDYPGQFRSATLWKLHYYQWVMQIFEQYGLSEAACHFAHAALEQVDEVLMKNDYDVNGLPEPTSSVRGRLWANVFKFSLDCKNYEDSYTAIISNPDEESKYICLRRFVNVLCELGATKILCDGQLPFVALTEKVELELAWKAERSDISMKPNLYKVLYAFESYRNNWRKAATYMYRYSERLLREAMSNERSKLSSVLQDRLHALSAAINALQLVDPAFAWFDSHQDDGVNVDQGSPNKRARRIMVENTSPSIAQTQKSHGLPCYLDMEMLQKEYVLIYAEYLLTLANVKVKYSGKDPSLTHLIDSLLQENLYDMSFTIILKFWKGSGLKRELERAFAVLSEKCSPNNAGTLVIGSNRRGHGYLLPPTDENNAYEQKDTSLISHQVRGYNQWETLEFYLEKYKRLHPRLPVTVAVTLLQSDPQIELPLWLVHMFKGGKKATSWGMTGQEADPASLMRLYVTYGHFAEATNLLLEFLESFAARKPMDVINCKKMSSIWFPYTAIERLWIRLEELHTAGHMVDQCNKLKRLIQDALMNHLRLVKVDSDDAVAASLGNQPGQYSS